MGLFGKLKDILFDEETVEIPIITKEDEEILEKEKEKESSKKKVNKNLDEEIVVHKIETPKVEDDDLFDMPKLKEEVKTEEKKNSFTFPVFDDDDKDLVSKRRSEKVKTFEEKPQRKASGFTNAYDYSYGKYKGDYKSSRIANQEILTKSLEIKEERKAFTPSPIISPVYGILNENYKKEDIVAKEEAPTISRPHGSLDLDSVRRKAYGTLEEEIEMSLKTQDEDDMISPMVDVEPEVEVLKEDGISINDLLIDSDEDVVHGETQEEEKVVVEENNELFDLLDEELGEVQEEIDIDEDNDEIELPISEEELDSVDNDDRELYQEKVDEVEEDVIEEKETDEEPPKEEKVGDDTNIEEDDLFDLIDSIYERKEEEE